MVKRRTPASISDTGSDVLGVIEDHKVAPNVQVVDDQTYNALAAASKYVLAAMQLAEKMDDPGVLAMVQLDLAKVDAAIDAADRADMLAGRANRRPTAIIPPRRETPQTIILEQVRDRMMSLQADPENYKVELRSVFLGGFSQAKREFRVLLHEMMRELGREP